MFFSKLYLALFSFLLLMRLCKKWFDKTYNNHSMMFLLLNQKPLIEGQIDGFIHIQVFKLFNISLQTYNLQKYILGLSDSIQIHFLSASVSAFISYTQKIFLISLTRTTVKTHFFYSQNSSYEILNFTNFWNLPVLKKSFDPLFTYIYIFII